MPAPLFTQPSYGSPISRLLQHLDGTEQDTPTLPLYLVDGTDEARTLATTIFNPRRRFPLVVVSHHRTNGILIDIDDLVTHIGDLADVVLLANYHTGFCLSEALPDTFAVYNGAVRIYHTGATDGDRKYQHPLIPLNPDSARPQDAVLERISHHAHPPQQRPSSSSSNDTEANELARQVHQLQDKVNTLTTELTTTREELRQARADRDTARKQLAEDQQPVYADPLLQFSYELFHTWLTMTSESERDPHAPGDTWPLRYWVPGEEFLDSVHTHQLVSRSRIIRACVDVITGRALHLDGRNANKFRNAKGHNDVRRDDGALLWRCSIAENTAQAPRLLWWELPDQSVELCAVLDHKRYSSYTPR